MKNLFNCSFVLLDYFDKRNGTFKTHSIKIAQIGLAAKRDTLHNHKGFERVMKSC